MRNPGYGIDRLLFTEQARKVNALGVTADLLAIQYNILQDRLDIEYEDKKDILWGGAWSVTKRGSPKNENTKTNEPESNDLPRYSTDLE